MCFVLPLRKRLGLSVWFVFRIFQEAPSAVAPASSGVPVSSSCLLRHTGPADMQCLPITLPHSTTQTLALSVSLSIFLTSCHPTPHKTRTPLSLSPLAAILARASRLSLPLARGRCRRSIPMRGCRRLDATPCHPTCAPGASVEILDRGCVSRRCGASWGGRMLCSRDLRLQLV
jgi:hypothetical protein